MRDVIKIYSNCRDITFISYIQNVIQHPAVNVNSVRWGNYCGSSVWNSTQQVIYWEYILHSSNTRDNEAVHQLFIYSKQAYDSFRREVLYDIRIESCIPMNLVRLKNVSKWKVQQSLVRQTFVWYVSYWNLFETKHDLSSLFLTVL
jgi:prolipoprotein diacylglyceryltransferase